MSKTISVGPSTWQRMVNDGLIFETTKITKDMGVVLPTAISPGLYKELMPWAEDMVIGATYEGRVEELIKGFKKEFRNHNAPYGEFFIKFTSRVKEIVNPAKDKIEARTYDKGKKVDKIVNCFVGLFPKGNRPAIVFGIKGETGPMTMKEGINNEFFGNNQSKQRGPRGSK